MDEQSSHGIGLADRKRIVGVALFVGVLLCLLIVQFFRIQIIQGERWEAVANAQHSFVVEEPFVRGSFYANTMLRPGIPEDPQPLVVDILKFHLYIDPKSLPEPLREEIALHLATLVEIDVEGWNLFREQFDKRSRSRRLKSWLSREERDQIKQWWRPYARQHKIARNAVYFVADFQRSYPFGSMLGAVLHTVRGHRDEQTRQAVPTGGLELRCQDWLKGTLGKRRLMRSPRNRLATGELLKPPENGADVYLTINHVIQEIAEEELEAGVIRTGAKKGWAAMMDPYTGAILALAQYPPFSPADYASYFNDPEKMEATKVWAVTDVYEPGSTLKPICLALALESNQLLKGQGEEPLFDPDAKMATSDGRFPGRKPLTEVHTHYFLNFDMGMQKSSNIYCARVAEKLVNRLGNDYFRGGLVDTFGLGTKTGIELPGESPGVVPKPGRYYPSGRPEWSLPTPFSLAIGYNIQVNSIQLLRTWSILANGGYLVEPTILGKVVKTDSMGNQKVLLDHTCPERRMAFPKVLSDSTVERVMTALRYVTKPGGSARRADISGYSEVGKSGTARKIVNGQYSRKHHHASFMGFTPVDNPAFVLTVVLDEPEVGYVPGVGHTEHGGVAAAPVFRAIATRTLEYLGVAPDDPYGYPVGDPRRDPEKGNWIEQTRRLAELYNNWNRAERDGG